MEAMGDAKVKAIHYICIKEFEKLISVANPTHGNEFQSEVSLYFDAFYINLVDVIALWLISMVNYLGKYILEYKYEARNVVGEAPKNHNFCSSCRVQGAMIEVVESKSYTVVSNLFSATKCGGGTSWVFSHSGFNIGLGIINYIVLIILVCLC